MLRSYAAVLLASLALSSMVYGADSTEKPWPESLIERLPADFRPLARLHAEDNTESVERLQKSDERATFWQMLDDVIETDEGMVALMAVFRTASSRDRRIDIANFIGERGVMFSSDISGVPPLRKRFSQDTYEKVQRAFQEEIADNKDTEYAITVLAELQKLERRRLLPIVRARLNAAILQGDRRSADLFRQQDAEVFAGKVSLPKFAYRAPPVFEAAPAHSKRLRVLAFGDFGTGGPAQHETAAAMRAYDAKNPFTFGLTLGDNFYLTGLDDPDHERWKTQWEDIYGPLGIIVYPSFGNHDYMAADSPAAELAYSSKSKTWHFPAPFYTYTAGPAQFFVIDNLRLFDDQLSWLEAALKGSTARWKIVYGHYPIFVANPVAIAHEADPDSLVNLLLPVLARGGADVYLAGHHHSMKEMKTQDGVHFFIFGSGGAKSYEIDPTYARTLFANSGYGFGVLDIDSQNLAVSFISTEGKVLHRRDIQRASGP